MADWHGPGAPTIAMLPVRNARSRTAAVGRSADAWTCGWRTSPPVDAAQAPDRGNEHGALLSRAAGLRAHEDRTSSLSFARNRADRDGDCVVGTRRADCASRPHPGRRASRGCAVWRKRRSSAQPDTSRPSRSAAAYWRRDTREVQHTVPTMILGGMLSYGAVAIATYPI